MDSARFSRAQLAFLVRTPLAWAVLLLFHPTVAAGVALHREAGAPRAVALLLAQPGPA